MYFNGQLAIDPSQETLVEKVRPTKVFGRMLYYLTAGGLSDREEQETFTAVAILQQLNMALRSMGVTNIVRLAKDQYDFYFDEQGLEDDLKAIMEQFHMETDYYESELFEALYLVVEYADRELTYLIEIEIDRLHPPDVYPITITVNGTANDFAQQPGESADNLRQRMEPVFQVQDAYERFQRRKEAHFSHFISRLNQAVATYIKCDDVRQSLDTRVIRPREPVDRPEQLQDRRTGADTPPLFHGYHGFDAFFLYAWMWSSMSFHHNIHYHDVSVVDEQGQTVFDVGAAGFHAGESNTLNPEADFESPSASDVEYHADHSYQDGLDQTGSVQEASAESGESSSWLDVGGDSGDSGASCSSCSSCSSCGGI